jgi:N-acyl-D-aspartate/D-glutamate deacylase
MFDLLIRGGEVIDGTGRPAFRADVGVRAGRIAEVGRLAEGAGTVIEAEGRVVAPGFIDIHTHSDFNLPINPVANGKTEQGVTTEVTGNCGFSPAPVVPAREALFRENVSFVDTGLDYAWRSFAEFLERMPPLGLNMAPLVGHTTVRCGAMGVEDRPPTPAELEHMRALVAEAMQAGAFGFSTGLIYPPACYADADELVELARVAAQHGGGYFVHMRDEADGVLDSLAENIQVGERSGAHVQISHLKVGGAHNRGRAPEVLAFLDAALARGVKLHCDQYPYNAGSTGLKVVLPPWTYVGGSEALVARLQDAATRARIRAEVLRDMASHFMRLSSWEQVMIAESPSQPDAAGLHLAELGRRAGREPVEAMMDLLIADRAKTLAVYFLMDEGDVRRIMAHPQVAIGSDGIYFGRPGHLREGRPHPRYFGTFPRVVGRYARDEGVLALPEAVRKMTALCADIVGLKDRGRVQAGLAADLVVFDAARILDRADYLDPFQPPDGVDTVIVNGTPVVRAGRATGDTPGRVLRLGRTA